MHRQSGASLTFHHAPDGLVRSLAGSQGRYQQGQQAVFETTETNSMRSHAALYRQEILFCL